MCGELILFFSLLPMTRVSSFRTGGKCCTLASEIKTDLSWGFVLEMALGAKAHKG